MTVRTRWVVLLTGVVCLPLVVALVALARTHWSPVLDLAMTELRVRDVGTWHTPLIGLPGRVGNFPDQGSHPGPLSFYLLAPTYRLFGSTAWSMELGTVIIHTAAVAAALSLAARRGGRRGCIAVAVLLSVIMRGYGGNVLTQPWNPYLPVIPWIVVLLAVWSVLEGDAAALVVFVAAGSLCAQTHLPYIGLVGGLGGLLVMWLVLRQRIGTPVSMPGLRRWSITAGVLGVLLWLPPVADQLRRTPGNLSMLSDYFRNPPEESIGFRHAARLLLEHLNVVRVASAAVQHSDYFKTVSFSPGGSLIPGVLVVLLWVASVVVAWRLGVRSLVHLHAVIGATLLLEWVAMARIFGKVWYYLTFWAWGVLMLMLFAICWSAAVAVRRWSPARSGGIQRIGAMSGVALLSASTLAFSWSALSLKPPENQLSRTLGAVVGPTANALAAGTGAADGKAGTYLITWTDVAFFGSQGYGLVSELERRGFTVGVANAWRVPVTQQRVLRAADSTAEVHLATGKFIDEWRAKPGVVEVAFVEPRNSEQLALYNTLRDSVISELRSLGLGDLVDEVDSNLFSVQLDPRVPPSLQARIDRMLLLGQPTAVFIAPAGTSES
ncbi:MAG: hypothetical protein F2789_04250 [Actinobacteria bacterium]|nr:hypothetical protein [Actinomycetota bacterium]